MPFSSRLRGARRACPLALLAGALCAASVHAGPNDALQASVGVGYLYDDNLFRLADGQPAYDGTRADGARQGWLALLFDHSYGRQHLLGHARFTRVAYDHFTQLNYNGEDAALNWDWQLGNHLQGKAGAAYQQSLAPYADFRSSERNLRTERHVFFDGAWRAHPSWQLRAAGARDTYNYDLSSQRYSNRTENALEAGLDYVPAGGSSIGVLARRVEGRYPNLRPFGNLLVSDNFDQDELKLKVDWKASAISTLQLTAGHARRRYAVGGEHDAAGFNGRATWSVDRGGKLRWNVAAWREFAAIESDLVSYSLNKGASATVSVDATAKVRVEAGVNALRRNFNAISGTAVPRELQDTLRQASLSTVWAPRARVAVTLALAHERRSGLPFLGNGSFRANTVNLNLSAQF
jgi:exopolysaccharide biosynthesis operon protein EpsL